MLVMFILGLILIGMLAVAANSLTGLYGSLSDVSAMSRERQIEMLWESGISAMLIQAGSNAEYIAPLGEPLKDEQGLVIGQTLPTSVSGPRLNTKGFAPRYCALGRAPLSGAASKQIVLSKDLSYGVETVTAAGVEYVARSETIKGLQRGSTSVVGFIISPFEASESLSCAQITYDTDRGVYSTPGLNTRVIPLFGANGGTLTAGEAINRSSSQFIDASQFDSINQALEPYLHNPPRRIVLNLPERSAGYKLTGDLAFGRSTASDAELIIAGGGEGQVAIQGAYSMALGRTTLALSHVSLQAAIQSTDSDVTLASSAVGSLSAINSKLKFSGDNTISGGLVLDNSYVDQTGGLSVDYTGVSSGAIAMAQSSWRMREASLTISGNSAFGLWLDQHSVFTARSGSVNLKGSYDQGVRVSKDSNISTIATQVSFSGSAGVLFDLKGQLVALGGRVISAGSVGSGAVLRDGASILLDNDQQWFASGNPPQVGVLDQGGLGVAGAAATVGGTACWKGYLFSASTGGQVSNNNNESMQGRVTASWSCAQ